MLARGVSMLVLTACAARSDLGTIERADASTDARACTLTMSNAVCAPSSCGNLGCTTTVANVAANDVVADDTNIYWTTATSVVRASPCGATPTTLVTCATPTTLALDDSYIDFIDETSSGVNWHAALRRINKQGGVVATLATFDDDAITALAPTSDAIFVAVVADWTTSQGQVVRVSKADGAVLTIFSGPLTMAIAADDDFVFWTTQKYVMRAGHDGTNAISLPSVEIPNVVGAPNALALDAQYVYWSGGCGTVMRAARNATGEAELIGSVSQSAGIECYSADSPFLGVDATYVYMTFGGNGGTNGGIFRMPKGGGDLSIIVADSALPTSIAVGELGLFWVDTNTIKRLTP